MTLTASIRQLAARVPLLGALGLSTLGSRPSASDIAAFPLSGFLRSQAVNRWMLPYLAAITPQYIEMTLRSALAGNHAAEAELFRLMIDTWPELASVVAELTEGVLARQLVFEPACDEDEEPTDEAVRRCKLVSKALHAMAPALGADENDLKGTIRDFMSGWFMGQVVLAINYDAADGLGGLHQIESPTLGVITAPRSTFWVHPNCYVRSREGQLGLRLPSGADLPRAKARPAYLPDTSGYQAADVLPLEPDRFLVGVHKAQSGPVLGCALLRPLAWWWCAANFSGDWLLNFAQLFGQPFRWVNYDPNLPEPVKRELDIMLQNVGSAGYGRFPVGAELKLLESKATGGQTPTDALLDRADRYARMLLLGQTLSGATATAKGGGQAFGSVEADVKTLRIDAAADYVAGILTTQLVPAVLRVNFGDATESPTLRFLLETEGGLTDAQRDQTLAAAGLKIGVRYLRKKYGIPAPQKDEETIGGAPVATVENPKSKVQSPKLEEPKPPAAEPAEPAEARALSASSSRPSALDPRLGEAALRTALAPTLNLLDKIATHEDPAIRTEMVKHLILDQGKS